MSFSRTTRRMTRPQPRRAARAALVAFALATPLAGCSFFQAAPVQRGNRADPDLVAQLVPGVQTKTDVEALLGSPTATGTFDRNSWYYISSVTRMQPAGNPSSEQQRVIALTFDEGGVLRKIEQRGPDDMRNVSMVDRTTPVPGSERTLLQALFGNIGRVGAGNLGADTSPGGGPGR
ncbi:outer membrane protein assembly factor BamE [Roseomonas sp. E05]|uniref:outer membrane protein assembly factor BamE n=1 Tax=Roseomonas sp. E05 TaxID=3046310 RepID=UPI0024B9E395|nr:outer membrane protein assembly factor BamE [Roseomonas sp. E05]MDJ0389447.1 outer membrane protein assembly factor BamE [Roseomonas sp. E05]